MKIHLDEIAVFGGTPLFAAPRPIGQLAMPSADSYIKLIRASFEKRRFSEGPIVGHLEQDLAAFHQVDHCIAVANAGLALIMLMQYFADGAAGEVIMPAFSFRGLPHFAQWAGQLPRFCDVEEVTHGLDVNSVEAAIGPRTTSILAVCNFNSAGNVAGLTALSDRRGIPLFFDSVYGIGSTLHGRKLGGNGRAEVFSTHATKLLNGFEGGYITTNDANIAKALRRQRESTKYNLRLNELHAAMALLCLRDLDAVIERNRLRYTTYESICAAIPDLDLTPYAGTGETVTYQMAIAKVGAQWPLTRDQTIRVLRAEGAAITGYYNPPLHKSVHCPPKSLVPDLPVSESLAKQFLQFPVGELMSVPDIERLGDLLVRISHDGDYIAQKLSTEVPA